METNAYKEFSYKVRGFKTLSIIIACVTVLLCLLVGVGCWVLVAGVRENESHLHHNGDVVQEKLEVEVVKGNVEEPLRLQRKESMNKVGRVVQHIAEIDFDDGSSTEPKAFASSVRLPEAPPTIVIEEIEVIPEKKEEVQYNVQEMEAIREKIGQPIEIDGVVGVRLQPPAVDGVAAPSPNNGQYMKNDLTVVEEPAAVYSATFREEHVRPDAHPSLHQSILDTLVNFTSELSEDIAKQGLFDTLIDRTSEKYMRDTFQWIGDYTSQLVNGEQLAPRNKRSVAYLPFTDLAGALVGLNYALFAKFMYHEVDAIAEYNMQARKLSSNPAVEFLESSFWAAAAPATASPKKDTEEDSSSPSSSSSSKPLTAANDDWEPQVNKVSLAFIGEILTTLLNMMREYLMKDHVMECLWFMFCEDLNHQAKYADVYGLLARVNSVGLKVLIEKEDRQMDTMGEVWRALTAWETLQCEDMFPKCDGPKALEIVNEVALAARK